MISSSKSLSVITIISYLLCLTTNVQSQDVCICQPSTYQMQLNFALTCNDSNIYNADETNTNFTYPNGILESRCLINGRENNITDVIPLFVSTIQILELDINRNIINQEVLSDTYMSGDSITFTSIIASTDPNEIDPITNGTVIPYGIQALITGSNENGEAVVNSWVIIYDNTDCNTFPLLQANSNIGWVTFTTLGDPSSEICPLLLPSDSPTPLKIIESDQPTPVIVQNTTSPTPLIIGSDAPTPALAEVTNSPTGLPMTSDKPSTGSPIVIMSDPPTAIVPTIITSTPTATVPDIATSIPTTTAPDIATSTPTTTTPLVTPITSSPTTTVPISITSSPTTTAPIGPTTSDKPSTPSAVIISDNPTQVVVDPTIPPKTQKPSCKPTSEPTKPTAEKGRHGFDIDKYVIDLARMGTNNNDFRKLSLRQKATTMKTTTSKRKQSLHTNNNNIINNDRNLATGKKPIRTTAPTNNNDCPEL